MKPEPWWEKDCRDGDCEEFEEDEPMDVRIEIIKGNSSWILQAKDVETVEKAVGDELRKLTNSKSNKHLIISISARSEPS